MSKDGHEFEIIGSVAKLKSKYYICKFKDGVEVLRDMRSIKRGILRPYENIVGKTFNTNYGDSFEVMSKIQGRYNIKFNTGNYKVVTGQSIKNGTIRNPQSKSVYGIGVTGKNGRKHFLYTRWSHMIRRCYNIKDRNYRYYGAKGVTVCQRWLFLENYISDVMLLEGYDENLVKSGKLHLDKDIINREALIYSPETCKWVTHYDNTDESTKRQNRYKFIATNLKTNEVIISDNQTKFAKDNNLCVSCINRILLNKAKTKEYKNWKFELLEKGL